MDQTLSGAVGNTPHSSRLVMPKRKTKQSPARQRGHKKQKPLDSRPRFYKEHDLPWAAECAEPVWAIAMSASGPPVVENGAYFPGVPNKFVAERFFVDTRSNVCGVFRARVNLLAVQVGVFADPLKRIVELWPNVQVSYLGSTSKGSRYLVSVPFPPEWGDPTMLAEQELSIMWRSSKARYKVSLRDCGDSKCPLPPSCAFPEEGPTLAYLRTIASKRFTAVMMTLSPDDAHLVTDAGLIRVSCEGTMVSHNSLYLLPPSVEQSA